MRLLALPGGVTEHALASAQDVEDFEQELVDQHALAMVAAGLSDGHIGNSRAIVFAVLSSSMFMTWQRTVGGRIKSDLRFSSTVVWNNFPLPALAGAVRADIVAAGESVAKARRELGGLALADLYPPSGLDPVLRAAHDELDEAVDAAFGILSGERLSERQRQDVLFLKYQELASGLLASLEPGRVRRRAGGSGV